MSHLVSSGHTGRNTSVLIYFESLLSAIGLTYQAIKKKKIMQISQWRIKRYHQDYMNFFQFLHFSEKKKVFLKYISQKQKNEEPRKYNLSVHFS